MVLQQLERRDAHPGEPEVGMRILVPGSVAPGVGLGQHKGLLSPQSPPQALGIVWAEPTSPGCPVPPSPGSSIQGREEEHLLPQMPPEVLRDSRSASALNELRLACGVDRSGAGSRGASESGAAGKSLQISLSFLTSRKTLKCWSGSREGQ